MAERVANRRKSQMFLTNISPVTNTFDELVKDKLLCGKFPLTASGVLKMVSLVFLLAGEMMFLVDPICSDDTNWYPYLLPVGVGITFGVHFILFLIFSLGFAANNPGLWIKMDIVSGLLCSVFAIICSSMSLRICSGTQYVTNKVSECLAITGAVVLILSSVAMILMYRYIEDPEEEPEPVQIDTRKSIFA